ncbi:stathmin domain-containing protein 1-like [Micropterus salmoides]|uniref:stathmin domain-containing protein 1-like n=1 Tax=Micropterus salmoides TaxID=27706 RepID=UPI0018EC5316|nr:stathmin domain-containing protein 1-like [Micropterus salmoides]
MGCGNSTNTVVQPLRPEEVNEDEDETGSKLDGRGDSAVSKGTTDSGVVMENREMPVLPGAVPRKLPALTSVREPEADRITQDGFLQQDSTVQERPKSSEILEELLNQGIIPVGQTRERGGRAGEAYSIMLDDREVVRRRPPARLESLKAKEQSLPSREVIEEKIRLAEERRKLREDELKTRLRTKSARVRCPAPTLSTEVVDEDAALTPVELLQHPLNLDPLDPPPRSQVPCKAAEGGERVREPGGDSREEMSKANRRERRRGGGESGDNRGEGADRISEDNDGEEEVELTHVEELRKEQLESDSSFQHAEDKEEIF